jgi:3D (Asp-Asp-Asp) domain-containing protein
LTILALAVSGFHPKPLHRRAVYGPPIVLNTTSYCQGSITSAGIAPYLGEVAVVDGAFPLGTRIKVYPPVYGLTHFRVEDHIGWGSEMDFYNPSCSAAIDYGRRDETIRVLR